MKQVIDLVLAALMTAAALLFAALSEVLMKSMTVPTQAS